jgi:hypothetical protein
MKGMGRCGVTAAFSTHGFFLLVTVLDTDVRVPSLVENLEWELLEVGLDLLNLDHQICGR